MLELMGGLCFLSRMRLSGRLVVLRARQVRMIVRRLGLESCDESAGVFR